MVKLLHFVPGTDIQPARVFKLAVKSTWEFTYSILFKEIHVSVCVSTLGLDGKVISYH